MTFSGLAWNLTKHQEGTRLKTHLPGERGAVEGVIGASKSSHVAYDLSWIGLTKGDPPWPDILAATLTKAPGSRNHKVTLRLHAQRVRALGLE